MASRGDYRRRDRSWEKHDRERDGDRYLRGGRSGGGYRDGGRRQVSRSRSRSPRRGERERRGRRDYGRDREDERRRDVDKRDRDSRDGRRRDGRDEKRDTRKRDDDIEKGRDLRLRDNPRPTELKLAEKSGTKDATVKHDTPLPPQPASSSNGTARIKLDPDTDEEGEAMDDIAPDDTDAMMAVMGMAGFGTTKGKQVEGNQEGGVNVKKVRTWRQYMNRRGGFNRPLDRIK